MRSFGWRVSHIAGNRRQILCPAQPKGIPGLNSRPVPIRFSAFRSDRHSTSPDSVSSAKSRNSSTFSTWESAPAACGFRRNCPRPPAPTIWSVPSIFRLVDAPPKMMLLFVQIQPEYGEVGNENKRVGSPIMIPFLFALPHCRKEAPPGTIPLTPARSPVSSYTINNTLIHGGADE